MRTKTFFTVLVGFMLAIGSASFAGEWMFRLRDAHVQLRRALIDKDADSAWEHVDRSTRQQAGILALRIREEFEELPGAKKEQLRKALAIQGDEAIRTIRGRDLLVAKFFLDAHPYMLVGDRDDARLKDHGTKMAGPTGIVVHRKTPDELIVQYRFTTEGHFGGQAMDYRAVLEVPSLEEILGPPPPLKTLSPEETADQAVAMFLRAQEAFREEKMDIFWSLIDCDSQSQASHFADQARERGSRQGHESKIMQMLGLGKDELAELAGPGVWSLQWARDDLSYFLQAKAPRYVTAEGYDQKLVPVPTGYKRRDKAKPEGMIEFEAEGRTWQIPARLNYRNGLPEIKIFLRPPFYLRLRT